MPDARTRPEPSEIEQGIRECSTSLEYLSEALNYSLGAGGRHVEGAHISLLVDAIELCRTTLDFLLRGSDRALVVCAAAAAVCAECADDCDRFADDARLRACAAYVRRCALACRHLAQRAGAPLPVAQAA